MYTVYHSEDKRVKDKLVFTYTHRPVLVSRADGVDIGEKIVSTLQVQLPLIMPELNKKYKDVYDKLYAQYINYIDSLSIFDDTDFRVSEFLAILSYNVTDALFEVRKKLIEQLGVLDIAFNFTDIDFKTGKTLCKIMIVFPSHLTYIASMSYLTVELNK